MVRFRPLLIDSAVAALTAGIGLALLTQELGVLLLGCLALYAVAVVLGSRNPSSGPVAQGLPGLVAGVLLLTVVVPIVSNLGLGVPATSGLDLMLAIAALLVGMLVVPGALLGRGLVTGRNGMAAVGCLLPAAFVLLAGFWLSTLTWGY